MFWVFLQLLNSRCLILFSNNFFKDTSKLWGFFLSKTVTIQLLGSMPLQRFLHKMKLSKQFVIRLTFYSVFLEPEEGWFFQSYTITIFLTGSILISFFLREKFWSSNFLFNEKAFLTWKNFPAHYLCPVLQEKWAENYIFLL